MSFLTHFAHARPKIWQLIRSSYGTQTAKNQNENQNENQNKISSYYYYYIISHLRILQSDWPRGFLLIFWEPEFSQTFGFHRILKKLFMHYLNPKKLYINEHNFSQNPKIPIFGVFWGFSLKFQVSECVWMFSVANRRKCLIFRRNLLKLPFFRATLTILHHTLQKSIQVHFNKI